MVQPFNYTFATVDPFQKIREGLQFTEGQARRAREDRMIAEDRARQRVVQGQQDTLFAQGQEDRAQRLAQAEQAQADAMQMRRDLEDLASNPNPVAADYAQLVVKYPQIGSELRQAWTALDDANQQTTLRGLAETYAAVNSGNIEVAEQMLSDRAEAQRNSGQDIDAQQTEAMLQLLRTDPNAVKTTLGIAIKSIAGNDFDSLLGEGAGVSRSETYGNGTILRVMTDGERVVTDPEGNEVAGADAARVIQEAVQFDIDTQAGRAGARTTGALKAEIELGGEAAAAELAGKTAQEVGLQAFERAGSIRQNIANLDAVVSAIDAGAKTGQIQSRVPTWNAATIELRNLQSQLGLDVIGAVTFGALSEGELRLALQTALPTGLDEAELRDWVIRKKETQEKLLAYMEEQARFLSRPGNTVAGWLDLVDQRAGQQQEPTQQQIQPGASFLQYGGQ